MFNEFSNRNSNIDDVNYGKQKQTKPSLEFSKEKVYEVAQRIIIQATQKFLPQRAIQSETTTTNEFYHLLQQIFGDYWFGLVLVDDEDETRLIINVTESGINAEENN